ncbi:3-oxoacyl-(Acyl-carrier-protein) reductase [Desulforamulus hydrothermalis Lam5 = DSM 18033]|uniref:3-oxoacyl-(Acyl-carrier-protein) reductase n=2 Tax=Desulforamulus TaxID=2916693 RepID=K8EDJ5_9FIRM|nr:3-oxoacyl-(Acyl-carrier-protein) reductase [Desulforamulus hydrothermalis Lam5 = DSM 18033]SHH46285.1 Short-chain dehydrogenase [Desulforamulus hydrothermalis Lam5 = DSM 18033]
MSTWLITGCSSGLGRHLAQAVLKRGYNVVVTARKLSAIQDIVASYPDTALALQLDVTDHTQVDQVVQQAEARFGGVDVLVNNAGHGYRAAVEEGDEVEVDELFATNFFGPVALIKAVLPGMRTRHHGTIVNVSSIAARVTAPGSGYYSATKCALEGLSDGLRKEVSPLGIKVIVVEPGEFRTDFSGRSLKQSRTVIADYAETAGRRRIENDTTDGHQIGDPAKGAQLIIKAVEAYNPPSLLLLGSDAVRIVKGALDEVRAEVEAWEKDSIATDFPS